MKIGDIKRAKEIRKAGGYLYIWAACQECGKERWTIRAKSGFPKCSYCNSCANKINGVFHRKEKSATWKGGHYLDQDGYVQVVLYPNDPFYEMAMRSATAGHRIAEHRLIMAQHLGRPLLRKEIVHHKNGIRTDNRIENLELLSLARHMVSTLNCLNCDLRKEIRLLRWEIKELREALKLKLDLGV